LRSTRFEGIPIQLPWKIQSALPTIVWPAFPAAEPAAALGLLFQMESAQWLPPEHIRESQLLQAEKLLRHAYATVPYYRERWKGTYDPSHPLTAERFIAIPILARRELQDHFDALRTSALPAGHGGVGEVHSSGSTGTSVRVLKTQIDSFLWNVLTLRDHLWHKRDMRSKLVAIRHGIPEGEFDDWGPSTRGVVATGRSAVLGIRADVGAQLRWLEQQQPAYLTTYPSNAAELARTSLKEGIRLPSLREVRTVGELLAPDVRELCRNAWGVPTTDIYSSEETG
jgi:phenylacetate-CoA ligase